MFGVVKLTISIAVVGTCDAAEPFLSSRVPYLHDMPSGLSLNRSCPTTCVPHLSHTLSKLSLSHFCLLQQLLAFQRTYADGNYNRCNSIWSGCLNKCIDFITSTGDIVDCNFWESRCFFWCQTDSIKATYIVKFLFLQCSILQYTFQF